MARYTCFFTVATPLSQLRPVLTEVLHACNLPVIYDSADYMMARELPGKVAFAKLVTVEVLIDHTTATDQGVQVNLVIKNEELPLQINNHCRQIFDQLHTRILENSHCHLIASVADGDK